MITVHAAMLVLLGFLLAALLLLLFLPAYRRRIERFTNELIKRSLPLTEAEIRADKDRIRANFAIDVHKLEMKLEEASLAAARQSVEINRREAKIHELEQAVDAQKSFVEEHQNARRVLEQAIMDRLPKVEQRLSEARQLLVERDREIAQLMETGAKQASAIEEASQINIQQADELHRARSALETRAIRNREQLSDGRFDGEVALRSEIETLRAKSREQTAALQRLQAAGAASDEQHTGNQHEIARLNAVLAKAEAELDSLKSSERAGNALLNAAEQRTRELEKQVSANSTELSRLRASVKTYEEAAAQADAGKDNRIAVKAEMNALQAELDQNRKTIEALRAEIAADNARLSRQAQHFRDEMQRSGSAASQTEQAAGGDVPRKSLAERIAQPRTPARIETITSRTAATDRTQADVTDVQNGANGGTRTGGYLRAVNGGNSAAAEAPAASNDAVEPTETANAETTAPRRPRLLERIGNIDKN